MADDKMTNQERLDKLWKAKALIREVEFSYPTGHQARVFLYGQVVLNFFGIGSPLTGYMMRLENLIKEESQKFPIQSSNLTLRFYKKDGWTEELLNSLVAKGKVTCAHPDDTTPYWTLTVGSSFDVPALMTRCSVLHRAFDDDLSMTDEEFIRKMNW